LWGAEVLQAVARGSRNPPVPKIAGAHAARGVPETTGEPQGVAEESRCRMDVESDVVLPRGMLLALADRGEPGVDAIMQASPWRLRRFGAQISAVLQGTP